MRAAPINGAKLWLIGGGLGSQWTYEQLANAIEWAIEPEPSSIASQLVQLTRALWGQEKLALAEPGFCGEGRWYREVGTEVAGRTWGAADGSWLSGSAEIVMSTSGSTGIPKTVRHTLPTLARTVVVAPRHAEDIWGLAYNPSHIAGVQVYLQALANGNSMVNLWQVDQQEAIERCRRYCVTHLSGTPTFYRLLLSANPELPELRSVSIGGEVSDRRLIEQLRSRFPQARLRNIYASTEAGSVLTSDGVDFTLPATPVPKVRLAEGRLWLHASLVNGACVSGEWYDTGDQVELTCEDPLRFRIVGRVLQWINVGGEKVNPAEVEAALLAQPSVALARVSSRRNSVTGEMVVAEIVPHEGQIDEAVLRKQIARLLPSHKIPRIIRYVDRLPLTPTGKVLRHA